MTGMPYWTPERILDAFRAWEAAHGRPPGVRDWRRGTPAHPASSTVYKNFGNWAGLMREAGHQPRRPHRISAVTRDEVCQAIYRWVYDHRRLPTWRDWVHAADGRPSSDQVVRLFGSWNSAIVAAGYEPRVKFRTLDGYRKQAGHRVREQEGRGLNAAARDAYVRGLAA